MHYDTWAVTPSTNDALYRAAASIAGAGALTLLTSSPGSYGYGYKVIFTSTGNETGKTYTLTGVTVGGVTVTESLAGAAGTTTSTNYFASITSISASAASVGDVKIGTTGSLALSLEGNSLHLIQFSSSSNISPRDRSMQRRKTF